MVASVSTIRDKNTYRYLKAFQCNLVLSYTSVCYDIDSFETEASTSKEEPRISLLAQYLFVGV